MENEILATIIASLVGLGIWLVKRWFPSDQDKTESDKITSETIQDLVQSVQASQKLYSDQLKENEEIKTRYEKQLSEIKSEYEKQVLEIERKTSVIKSKYEEQEEKIKTLQASYDEVVEKNKVREEEYGELLKSYAEISKAFEELKKENNELRAILVEKELERSGKARNDD